MHFWIIIQMVTKITFRVIEKNGTMVHMIEYISRINKIYGAKIYHEIPTGVYIPTDALALVP